jgi:integrase/recombinase XerD
MPDPADPRHPPPLAEHKSRFRGRDGVSAEERDLPPGDDPDAALRESAAVDSRPAQLDLFAIADAGTFVTDIGGLGPLTAHSSLDLARTDYRRHLELSRRPTNTIESYSYDLQVLEDLIGPKPINRIERNDIARFLGEANSKTTRKRRLTSARRFFRYLIDDLHVLRFDPTDGYYPHPIALRTPVPLFATEQAALMDAALGDEPWSALAIWLMMRLGLTRAELLALARDHIDRTQPEAPVVYVVYDALSKQSKDRRLPANAEFADLYDAFLAARNPSGILFPVGPQAVNGMVDRVRRAAGIERDVTPQTLRTTFAVEQARAGADQQHLLALLGLVNDPRNRSSVDRYIALAADPLHVTHMPEGSDEG